MTDIVERLRREVPHCENQSDYGESDLLILSAADEIERLREALRDIACECVDDCEQSPLGLSPSAENCYRFCARSALGEKE